VAGAHTSAHTSANTSARLFSLIETAKANELEPDVYLNHIFEKLPYCKCVEDYEKLLPWSVKAALFDFMIGGRGNPVD